jgi:hypothetical protein
MSLIRARWGPNFEFGEDGWRCGLSPLFSSISGLPVILRNTVRALSSTAIPYLGGPRSQCSESTTCFALSALKSQCVAVTTSPLIGTVTRLPLSNMRPPSHKPDTGHIVISETA